MGIEIGWFSFDGPLRSEQELQKEAGVFVVLSQEEEGYNMLDVDFGENLFAAVREHPRRACWDENAGRALHFAAYYIPGETAGSPALEKIVKEVRMQYVMACSPSETPTHGWPDR